MILHWIYNIGICFYSFALRIASLFNDKAKLFVRGRKHWRARYAQVFQQRKAACVWVHCASLGEFEQARPLIEALRAQESDLCIVVTFFSPSGYEVRKNYDLADAVFYLPLDTLSNAKDFIDIVQPDVALFVKYEFWYNYINHLHKLYIPILSVSSIFQDRHSFFKFYGGFQRKMLRNITYFFVQDQNSKALLSSIGIKNVDVVGDTRFDRAMQVAQSTVNYSEIEAFKGQKKLLVVGSSWLDDERLIAQLFSHIQDGYQLLIAPHEINTAHLSQIASLFKGYNTCRFTEGVVNNAHILILDTFGMLSVVYKYADVVWIGGGWNKTGIHNLVEAAVYAKPIFFGPNYSRYREANDLIQCGGVVSVSNAEEMFQVLSNENALYQMGNNAYEYVQAQMGATSKIVDYIVLKCLSSKP